MGHLANLCKSKNYQNYNYFYDPSDKIEDILNLESIETHVAGNIKPAYVKLLVGNVLIEF